MHTIHKRIWSLMIAALAFVVFIVLYANLAERSIGLQLQIETDRPSLLRIYWTIPKVNFGEDRKGLLPVDNNSSNYNINVQPKSQPFHFQISADADVSEIRLKSVTVRRIGRQENRYVASNLANRLIPLDGVENSSVSDNTLIIRSDERRLRFRLDRLDSGEKISRWIVAAQVLGGVAVAWLGCLLMLRLARQQSHRIIYIIVALSPIWWLPWIRLHLVHDAYIWITALTGALIFFGLVLLVTRLKLPPIARLRGIVHSPRVFLVGFFLVGMVWVGLKQIPQISGFWIDPTRSGADFPELRSNFESAFTRNFHYRKHFIELNSEVKVSALTTSPTHKIIVGQDNFMFEGRGERRVKGNEIQLFDNISDYMGQHEFNESELDQWASALRQRRDWLKQQDIPYLFVMAPTKDMIYDEKLPLRLRRHGGKKRRFDQLYEHLQATTDIPVLDLRPALLKAKSEHQYPELYYRSDLHWNFFGAFFAYEAIAAAVNKHYPQLLHDPLTLDDFSVDAIPNWVHHRFMNTLGVNPERHRYEHYIRMRPKDRSRFAAKFLPPEGVQDVHWSPAAPGKRPETQQLNLIENDSGELDTLLILGDSFIGKTILYFTVHSRNTLYQRAVLDFPIAAFKKHKPKLVIQEILNMYLLRKPPSNPDELLQGQIKQ